MHLTQSLWGHTYSAPINNSLFMPSVLSGKQCFITLNVLTPMWPHSCFVISITAATKCPNASISILFVQLLSLAELSKIRKSKGNQIVAVQRALDWRVVELKRIRFESVLVVGWRVVGFRGFISSRDTYYEHVFFQKTQELWVKTNHSWFSHFIAHWRIK